MERGRQQNDSLGESSCLFARPIPTLRSCLRIALSSPSQSHPLRSPLSSCHSFPRSSLGSSSVHSPVSDHCRLPQRWSCCNLGTATRRSWRCLPSGSGSHRRDCHFADIPSPSVLNTYKMERGLQQNDSLADGYGCRQWGWLKQAAPGAAGLVDWSSGVVYVRHPQI